jgi:acyl carrier protein phosphodiesterase
MDELVRRARIDTSLKLQDRLARASAEIDHLRLSLGGGARRQARIFSLIKQCDQLEAAIAKLDRLAT